jgi:hypothetical protein
MQEYGRQSKQCMNGSGHYFIALHVYVYSIEVCVIVQWHCSVFVLSEKSLYSNTKGIDRLR